MLEVASYSDQGKMDTMDFFRQYKIWQRRAKEKVEKIKTRK